MWLNIHNENSVFLVETGGRRLLQTECTGEAPWPVLGFLWWRRGSVFAAVFTDGFDCTAVAGFDKASSGLSSNSIFCATSTMPCMSTWRTITLWRWRRRTMSRTTKRRYNIALRRSSVAPDWESPQPSIQRVHLVTAGDGPRLIRKTKALKLLQVSKRFKLWKPLSLWSFQRNQNLEETYFN